MIFMDAFVDSFFKTLFDNIGSLFNIIWGLLCSIVYGLIVLAFNLFTEISQLDILSADKVNGIYQRLTMIITIVMVFYITFEFIKYVISPDTISDKEKGAGKIVTRIVTAILLIAFVPTIFSWGYKLQQKILDTNVIPVVVFGQKNWDYKSAGSNFAGNVFSAFYRANCNSETTEEECTDARAIVDENIAKFKEDKGLLALGGAVGNDIISSLKSIGTGKKLIQFDGLLALVFGCFTLYVLFSYVLDLGTRYIQLLFLQIIAPVAIISSITPQKDSMLKKWAKQCSTAYLDVFIRLAILYFMLLIVSILSSELDFYEMTKNGKQINVFVYIVIIAGLLIFVQRAPNLLKELLPQGGAASLGFGFSAKSRLEPLGKTIGSMVKPVASGIGLVAGARSIFKRGVGADGKKHLGLNKDLISEKDKKGNKFKDRLKRGATYAVSAAKASYKGASTGAKTGRFKDAQVSAQQSIQGDETTVVAGGSVLGKTFRGAHYQNKLADQNLSIKEMEENMQKREAQVNVEKSVKTGQDSSEDRAKKKLGTKEQKIKVGKTGMSTLLVGTTKDKPGELSNELTKLGINIKEENTTSEIYSMFEAVANSKKASADAINQELTKLEIQLASETDEQVRADLNAKKQQLEVLAQTKSAEAVEASTALTKAEKVLSRFAITQSLIAINGGNIRDFINGDGDAVLVSNLQTALTSIENVRNSMTDDEIKALGLTDEVEKSFRSLNITDFDTLDAIQSALTSHASREGDEISKIKENIRKIKESPEYNESTANAAEGKK